MTSLIRKLTVVGGGNAAHVFAGLAASRDVQTTVLTTYNDEAERWKPKIRVTGACGECDGPIMVTSNVRSAVKGSDFIILLVPATFHEQYLREIVPHLEDGCSLGALPGEGGFEMAVEDALKTCYGNSPNDLRPKISVFAAETLPWACRIEEYGVSVKVLGVKKDVDVAVSPSTSTDEILHKLDGMIGPVPKLHSASFLGVTLMNINATWHPTITYGQYRDWDLHTPFREAPLFYEGVDDWTAKKLQGVSSELLQIRNVIKKAYPHIDLGIVRPVNDWMKRAYAQDIGDSSCLRAMLNTNKGYQGLLHPMIPYKDGSNLLFPNFSYRYMTEDVPFGMLVNKGIAELAGVPTPTMDEILVWCQERCNKKYLVKEPFDASYRIALGSADLKHTRCPQRFGWTDLDSFIKAYNY